VAHFFELLPFPHTLALLCPFLHSISSPISDNVFKLKKQSLSLLQLIGPRPLQWKANAKSLVDDDLKVQTPISFELLIARFDYGFPVTWNYNGTEVMLLPPAAEVVS